MRVVLCILGCLAAFTDSTARWTPQKMSVNIARCYLGNTIALVKNLALTIITTIIIIDSFESTEKGSRILNVGPA